jgi:flagella basal body P-ring formation protein FlgA
MWRAIGLVLLPTLAQAESLVAARTIPAQARISVEDLMLVDADIPGALTAVAPALGLEARVAIYPGRPVRAGDIGPPALVERNAVVTLVFRSGGLSIRVEGRALQRAGAGGTVRAMNLASKTTVTGLVAPDGTVLVGGTP